MVVNEAGSNGNWSRYGAESRMQRPNQPQGAAAQLSRFSNSVAAHGSSHFDLSREDSTTSQWMDERLNDAGLSRHLLGGTSSSHKKDEQASRKEFTGVREYSYVF